MYISKTPCHKNIYKYIQTIAKQHSVYKQAATKQPKKKKSLIYLCRWGAFSLKNSKLNDKKKIEITQNEKNKINQRKSI